MIEASRTCGVQRTRDIEKYDTHIDPTVWIDSYAMAMGIQGHSELLAARYLPLMMDGVNRHWFNTLTVNSIDSWEEARAAFIQHFASAYSATTIEDLDRCVQGPPSRPAGGDNISISELFDIATRYADEDPTVDSDDSTVNDAIAAPHTRSPGVAITDSPAGPITASVAEREDTTSWSPPPTTRREPKSFRRDTRAPREDRPQPKRFDARSLLDAPCIYHSKEGKPANHTTGIATP
ncbi:hypothetical protein QYE76_070728 [Lolium multiflorum]|uniref:Retrotransposon gag domain-containing protein n=1 Tax=Lolium multiflorum TaxID=4521 RepID=A0AAD8WE66_LOLMU|nr:hypothetical protein QYE76_070728 [Lolium multiflorum]